MKELKNILIIVVIIGIGGFLIINSMNKNNEVKEISEYVNNNEAELERVAKSIISGKETDKSSDIKSVELYDDNGDKLVLFKLKDSDKNIGFYYSLTNYPSALQSYHLDLIELGGSKYKWDDDKTSGITSKIKDHWYFYKVQK